MNRLFNQESPVIRFLNGFADLILVNVLLIVFSIPLVTTGAAVTAALRITRDIMEDQAAHIMRTFWNAFRDNFKTSTLVWIPHSIILLGLSYNIYLF